MCCKEYTKNGFQAVHHKMDVQTRYKRRCSAAQSSVKALQTIATQLGENVDA